MKQLKINPFITELPWKKRMMWKLPWIPIGNFSYTGFHHSIDTQGSFSLYVQEMGQHQWYQSLKISNSEVQGAFIWTNERTNITDSVEEKDFIEGSILTLCIFTSLNVYTLKDYLVNSPGLNNSKRYCVLPNIPWKHGKEVSCSLIT